MTAKEEGTTAQPPQPSRRRFVAGALGVGAALAGCDEEEASLPARFSPPTPPHAGPPPPAGAPSDRPPLPDRKDAKNFLQHQTTPLALETLRDVLGTSVLTAATHLFVRQHRPLPAPELTADREGWLVQFAGVARSATLRVSELKQLGLTTVATVLQCAGNGRRYFTHGPGGAKWGVGAAGCLLWSGVPVRDVVAHLGGVTDDGRYLTATGGEPLPDSDGPSAGAVERSIPIEKALSDCLLAWEMNGEPIPRAHGGPLRLIVPGYYGCNQIKFLKRVAFTREQAPGALQQTAYRMRPVGVAASSDQPSMWAMHVKSFITQPTERTPVRAGQVHVTGVAFGGDQPVAQVEVSTDGERWRPTEFVGPDLGPYAWRVFHARLRCAPGPLKLFSRAVAADGTQQPERRLANECGYGNNSWRDLGVMVQVCHAADRTCLTPAYPGSARAAAPQARGAGPLSPAARRGRAIFQRAAQPNCTSCHALTGEGAADRVGPPLDTSGHTLDQIRTAIVRGAGAMPPFGEDLTAAQIDDVARYVFEVAKSNGG